MDFAKNVGGAKGRILSELLKIGGAIAPQAPPVPPPLHTNKTLSLSLSLFLELPNLSMNRSIVLRLINFK